MHEYVAHLDTHMLVWPSITIVTGDAVAETDEDGPTAAWVIASGGFSSADEALAMRRAAMMWASDEIDDYEFLTELGNAIGSVPKGFSTPEERGRVMNGLTIVAKEGEHTMCTVCQDAMKPETDAVELMCGHMYCRECIDRWLEVSTRCPLCGKDQEALATGTSSSSSAVSN